MPEMGKDKESEKFIVIQLQGGNEKAFQKLYNKYKDDIYTYSKSLLHSEIGAEEITQEVFLRVWVNYATLNPDQNFKAYIFTIARNLSFDILRKMSNNKKLCEEIFYLHNEAHDHPQQSIIDAEYQLLKQNAIESLPPKRKIIFEMSRNEGMSYEDIGSELGISVSTVKSQMSKALLTLRKYLQLNTDLTFTIFLWITLRNFL